MELGCEFITFQVLTVLSLFPAERARCMRVLLLFLCLCMLIQIFILMNKKCFCWHGKDLFFYLLETHDICIYTYILPRAVYTSASRCIHYVYT